MFLYNNTVATTAAVTTTCYYCSSLLLKDFSSVLDPAKLPLMCSALGIKREDTLERAWKQQLASVRWLLCVMEREQGHEEGVRREPGMLVPLF
jgi:hypothetical protein